MNIITHIRSPNFEERPIGCVPRFIIIHYIEQPFDSAISQYCDINVKLSPHYAIKKTGEIYNLVPDEHVAWHAGVSYWKGIEKLNLHSLGIEMDNMGNEPFTDEQMDSCIKLCHSLIKRHNIPRENVLGHSDISPGRKADPGKFFNWKLLDKNGIGIPGTHNLTGLSIYAKQQYLKDMGYKIEITGLLDEQTNHVIQAFEDHFYRREFSNKA
jgi:N-acetylmuramoyl-L-alanine amidase